MIRDLASFSDDNLIGTKRAIYFTGAVLFALLFSQADIGVPIATVHGEKYEISNFTLTNLLMAFLAFQVFRHFWILRWQLPLDNAADTQELSNIDGLRDSLSRFVKWQKDAKEQLRPLPCLPEIVSSRKSIAAVETLLVRFGNAGHELFDELRPEYGDPNHPEIREAFKQVDPKIRSYVVGKYQLRTIQSVLDDEISKHAAFEDVRDYRPPASVIRQLKRFEGDLNNAVNRKRQDFRVFSCYLPLWIGGALLLWGIACNFSGWWDWIASLIRS